MDGANLFLCIQICSFRLLSDKIHSSRVIGKSKSPKPQWCQILRLHGIKTTTTTIIAGLLKAAGYRTFVGGNIGHPLLCQLDSIRPDDMVVLELSSFQLMTVRQSPGIAVVTNLAPNHLDVHKDMAEYVAAKRNIFAYQDGCDRLVLKDRKSVV